MVPTSPRCTDVAALGAWQITHAKETGHKRFRNELAQYVELVPVDGSACTIVPTRSGGAT
ncbi:hypothetical protein SSPIM334S_00887 [Streptomyces spiroverticillatus]